jgi:hypothetical protein
MDFIERWLGISPDGGSGAVEVLWLVVLGAAIVVVARSTRRAWEKRRRG